MKIIFGIIIVAFFTFCGWLVGRKYTKKREFYQSLLNFNKLYLTNIKYNKFPLRKLITEINDNDLKCELSKYLDGVKTLNEVTYLSDDEKGFVKEYFNNLGVSDALSQEEYFSYSIKIIEDLLSDSVEKENKYKNTYIKLGFLFGIIVFILIL